MTPRKYLPVCAVCCFLLVALGTPAQTLRVINAEGHAESITAVQIANSPHVTVEAQDHDAAARFEGVPLSAILAMTGIPLGETMRGPHMTETLLAEAADGYKVVFALAECDPAFAVREIILADKRDGKPLGPKEGPFRVVAPGDKRPARWIRQVTTLRIAAVQ